ncbi:MAG TPA: NADH-quinone oxidoreductase subunit J, partial [Anaerolineae bacterium]|nr:NADH-quinone oxidoreductase subunit J [Anaerolineae bacterium]
MGQQIVFFILAVLTLVSAVVVVTDRNLFHAAIAMMASFFGVAGLYATLNSGFMAAAQLLVYIGAISILVIFAIMMTRRLMSTDEPAFNSQHFGAAIAALLMFGVLGFVFFQIGISAPQGVLFNIFPQEASNALLESTVVRLGWMFASPNAYVLPFEIASVLLLAALVGSIVIARPMDDEEEEQH